MSVAPGGIGILAQTLRWKSSSSGSSASEVLRISDSFVCGVAELLGLIASLRVKLYLEKLGCRRLTPLSVDALVLIAFPRILEWLGQLEPAGSQPLKIDGNRGCVTLVAVAERESDRIRNR